MTVNPAADKMGRNKFPEKRTIVDQKHPLADGGRAELRIVVPKPIGKRLGEEITGVDNIGRLGGDDGRTNGAVNIRRQFDLKIFLGDIDDFLNHQSHGTIVIRKNQNGLTAFGLPLVIGIERNERHQLPAILNNVLAVRTLDILHVDFLETRDQGQGHGFQFVAARAKDQHGGFLVLMADMDAGRFLAVAGAAASRGGRNAVGVQNHDYGPVPKDGVAGIELNIAQDRRRRLNDDFFRVEDPVDDNPESIGANLSDNDEHLVGAFDTRVVVFRGRRLIGGLRSFSRMAGCPASTPSPLGRFGSSFRRSRNCTKGSRRLRNRRTGASLIISMELSDSRRPEPVPKR